MSQDQIQLPEPDGYVWHEGRMAPSGGYEAGFGFSLSKPEEVEGAVFSHEVAPVYFAAPIRSLIERLEAAEKDAARAKKCALKYLDYLGNSDPEKGLALDMRDPEMVGVELAAVDFGSGGLAEGVSDA